jgi:Tfp pilus assembly protein PilF
MPIDDEQRNDAPPSEYSRETVAQSPERSSISNRVMMIGLFVGVLLVYLPSLRNEFVYDDYSMILHQPEPASLSHVGAAVKRMASGLPYYRPVTWSTFLVQKWLHGDSPAAFHFVNAALMAATACLAFVFLLTPAFRINRRYAACVYPAASGREALLAACLMLASACAFLRAGIGWYIAALLALLAALFSREQAIVLPAIFLIADVLKLSCDAPGRDFREWLSRYVPVIAVVVAWFAARWMLFSGSEFQLALINEPMGPLYSMAFAVQSIFAPFSALHYEPAIEDWFSWPRLLVASTGVLILLVSLVRSKSGDRRVAAFWLIWFVLVFLPTANILKQETEFDERYVLLSLLSVMAIAAMLASRVSAEVFWQQRVRWISVCLLTICVCLTVYRGGFYRDNLNFFTSWTQSSPGSAVARHNLANSLLARGHTDEAIESFQQAVRLNPEFTASHFDLAQTAASVGKTDLAERHYLAAIRLDPSHGKAHLYLGNVLYQVGNLDESLQHLQDAVRLLPESAVAHNSLGVTLHRQQKSLEARGHLETAVKLDPESVDAYFNLAEVLKAMDQPAESRKALQHALRLVPQNSWQATDIRQKLESLPIGSRRDENADSPASAESK